MPEFPDFNPYIFGQRIFIRKMDIPDWIREIIASETEPPIPSIEEFVQEYTNNYIHYELLRHLGGKTDV